MNEEKKLFIGFYAPAESSLLAAVKRLKIGSQKKEMEVNWVPDANYHVTTNFLGMTPSSRIDELIATVSKITNEAPPFSTSLRGLGAFPDEQHMRVLWVGVRKSRLLSNLQSELESSLNETGFLPADRDERDFIPHLTLARLRKSRSGTDLISPYVRTAFHDFNVPALTLFESLHHGPNPRYEPLHSFPLLGRLEE